MDFYVVYIHEAHPADGWVLESNTDAEIDVLNARSIEERQGVATMCSTKLSLSIPVFVDGMDNAADRAFNAWPERLYVISTDGTVAYQGGKGPYGFDPEELATFVASAR